MLNSYNLRMKIPKDQLSDEAKNETEKIKEIEKIVNKEKFNL